LSLQIQPFKIYNIIAKTCEYSVSERKALLLKELETLSFNEKDTSMSMFISPINNVLNELETLDVSKSNREKFDYWFNAISKYNKELIYFFWYIYKLWWLG